MARVRRQVAGVALAGLCTILVAGADETVGVTEIVQKNRAFAEREVIIERGSGLQFVNADRFPHQVHVTGPGMDVDSPLQSPGARLSVAFPTQGTFEVTCGIHPRMQMTVIVK